MMGLGMKDKRVRLKETGTDGTKKRQEHDAVHASAVMSSKVGTTQRQMEVQSSERSQLASTFRNTAPETNFDNYTMDLNEEIG